MGVFAGVLLALWAERRRRGREARRDEARTAEQLVDVRRTIMTSVVKNTSEAKRLRATLTSDEDPYLFNVGFELAVWEAVREQFVGMAPLEERILFTRFFDHLQRLARLVAFNRDVRTQVELAGHVTDEGDRALLEDISHRLRTVADDVRLEGIVLVTDHGEATHRRLLGLGPADAGPPS